MSPAAGVPAAGPSGLPPNPYNQHAWIIGEPVIGAGTWIGAFTVVDGSGGLQPEDGRERPGDGEVGAKVKPEQ